VKRLGAVDPATARRVVVVLQEMFAQ